MNVWASHENHEKSGENKWIICEKIMWRINHKLWRKKTEPWKNDMKMNESCEKIINENKVITWNSTCEITESFHKAENK